MDSDGQEGEITKGYKETFAGDEYVHRFGSGIGFTQVLICQNLSNYILNMFSLLYVNYISINTKVTNISCSVFSLGVFSPFKNNDFILSARYK